MGYRKKTLRKLTPEARKLAKLVGELESISRRLKNLVPVVNDYELWLRAEQKRQNYYSEQGQTSDDLDLAELESLFNEEEND